jgi:hypothetical protein
MKTALLCTACAVSTLLAAGCATSPDARYERYEISTRASDAMAPDNLDRGTKTLRVTTRTPPGLTVRLVAFYSQFHPPRTFGEGSVPRAGQIAAHCLWTESSLLQVERHYYTRVFHYPVGPGTQTQDLVLDEIVPGTCQLGITGIGYDVALAGPKGEAVSRYRLRFDIAIQEGGAASGEATVRCSVSDMPAGRKPALRCEREGRDPKAPMGPLAPKDASLTLDFRLADTASR